MRLVSALIYRLGEFHGSGWCP